MLKSKAFVKITKKGSVINVVKEHYLRDDIICSVDQCCLCEPLVKKFFSEKVADKEIPLLTLRLLNQNALFPFPHYLIPDTNIFLHHMDMMSHPYFHDVIVLQTVLEEMKHQNTSIYQRLRSMMSSSPEKKLIVFSNELHRETFLEREKGESPNDRNDRAIRSAAYWFSLHLASAFADSLSSEERPQIVFLSDDAENRNKAIQLGLHVSSMKDYVIALKDMPELVDMIGLHHVNGGDEDSMPEESFKFEEHLSLGVIEQGLQNGTFISGQISLNPYNLFEGTITSSIKGATENIFIIGRKYLNRAIHTDVVVVQVLPKDQWIGQVEEVLLEDNETEDVSEPNFLPKPSSSNKNGNLTKTTGKVVAILKRKRRQFCGSLDLTTLKSEMLYSGTPVAMLFVPIDRRIPKIRIRTRNVATMIENRIVVSVDSWPATSLRPLGHFVKSLGPSGDKNVETEALLLEHDVATDEFSKDVLNCLPIPNWNVQELLTETDIEKRLLNGLEGREDLRHLLVASIDPPGCTDIDDALHVQILPNGNYEVGVHIADVSHFVRPLTPMDAEAASRGTTVYLVDRRIDMLPSLLGTNLCSLKSNVDRFAFSAIWEMDPCANILRVRFSKTIINSKFSFTYDEAQRRMDDPTDRDSLTENLRLLNSLAKQLRSRRMKDGALTLASPEVRFALENDSQDPIDVELKDLKETNALVEEFMLLANISVAEKIYEYYPEFCLLRRHPAPPQSNFETLLKTVKITKNIQLDASNSKSLADSLDNALDPNDPYFNKLLRIITTRCMMQAVYFCSGSLSKTDFWHYGLATSIYTHFTSPIRRYADVIVHRLLFGTLTNSISSQNGYSKNFIEELCDNLNYRHRMAQLSSRSSVELFTYLFFKGRCVTEEAYVIKVLKNGLVVLIPKYGIEGHIPILLPESSMSTVAFDADSFSFVAISQPENPSRLVTIFDKLNVELSMREPSYGSSITRQKLKVGWLNAPLLLKEYLSDNAAVSDPAKIPFKRKKLPL